MATWAQFLDKATGAKFTHVNTHLDHKNQASQYCAADQFAGYVTGDPVYAGDGVDIDPSLPMVLTGDFNFARHDEESWYPEDDRGETNDPYKSIRQSLALVFGTLPPAIAQYDPMPAPVVGNRSPYHRLVTDGPFLDAFDVSEAPVPEPIGTFNGFDELREGAIDWIIVTPDVRVLQTYIETYRPDGHYPSDHLPAVADLLFDR